MQYENERKTNMYSVAYYNPQTINKTAHSFKKIVEVEAKLDEAITKEEKDEIIKEAHTLEKNKVVVYISRVMRRNKTNDCIMAPYGFK